jgi:HSP20 family protein
MATKLLMKPEAAFPSLFDDFFKPWNELFEGSRGWGRASTVPAVNIVENGKAYNLALAAPGLKKEDFRIDVYDDLLTISAEKQERKEEKDERYTRREYNYSSFLRSFPLPEDIKQDAIEAWYEDGVLKLELPKKEGAKKTTAAKQITVK